MKKFKALKTVLAASVLVAASGAANAAYVTAQGHPSSVVLTAFDTTLNVGYVRDLGIKYDTFYANLSAGNALAGLNTAGDATFTSTFAASNINDIQWNITAGLDLTDPDDRLLTSAADGTSPWTNNSTMGGASGNMSIFFDNLNTGSCAGAIVCAGGGSEPGNAAVFYGDKFNGAITTFSNAAYLDDSAVTSTNKVLDIFVLSKTLGAPNFFGNAEYEPGLVTTTDASFNANFRLLADGTLTNQDLSAVPLPAAVWMFGAGLMGFIGIGRRRKAS